MFVAWSVENWDSRVHLHGCYRDQIMWAGDFVTYVEDWKDYETGEYGLWYDDPSGW